MEWSLDFIIGMAIGVPVLLFCGIAFALGFWAWRDAKARNDHLSDAGMFTVVFGGVFLGGLLVMLGLTFPWEKQYHAYGVKDGTIQSIETRLIKSGDSMEEVFVVQFEDGQPYKCEDTRCALLEPGDYLALACIRVWEYHGTDGWDCKFRDLREAGTS